MAKKLRGWQWFLIALATLAVVGGVITGFVIRGGKNSEAESALNDGKKIGAEDENYENHLVLESLTLSKLIGLSANSISDKSASADYASTAIQFVEGSDEIYVYGLDNKKDGYYQNLTMTTLAPGDVTSTNTLARIAESGEYTWANDYERETYEKIKNYCVVSHTVLSEKQTQIVAKLSNRNNATVEIDGQKEQLRFSAFYAATPFQQDESGNYVADENGNYTMSILSQQKGEDGVIYTINTEFTVNSNDVAESGLNDPYEFVNAALAGRIALIDDNGMPKVDIGQKFTLIPNDQIISLYPDFQPQADNGSTMEEPGM